MRLLLAVLYSAFCSFDNEDEALDYWQETWESKAFPAEEIERYLRQYEDRFWLFHPEKPFYQIPGLDKRDDVFGPFNVSKLNGELSESDNKLRLFPQRSGAEKNSLSYAEAVRWLLYFNGFAETFGKLEAKGKTSKEDISVGVGWLGKLGLITAVGENLFQTLMLNFVLLDGKYQLWRAGKPIWEKPVSLSERNHISLPKNPCELLTLQSRRVLLEPEGGRVISFRFISGDIFRNENAFVEQMTPWRLSKQAKGSTPMFLPKTFQSSVQLWRDFSSLLAQDDKFESQRPGVVTWLDYLIEAHLLASASIFTFHTSGISYGTMQAVIVDVFSDSISFSAGLLSEMHKGWVTRIIAELSTTDMLVKEAGVLAQRIAKAAGAKDGKQGGAADGSNARDEARTQAYYRLDEPFRHWLESIKPNIDDMDNKCTEWWDVAQRIIRALGREIVDDCSPQAFIGRDGISAPNE
jgi:CRISPR system Cascade subunit CasA